MQSNFTHRIVMTALLVAASLMMTTEAVGARTLQAPQKDEDVVRQHDTSVQPVVGPKKQAKQAKRQQVAQDNQAPASGEPSPKAHPAKEPRVVVQTEPAHVNEARPEPTTERKHQPVVVQQDPQPRHDATERQPVVVAEPRATQERQPVPDAPRLSEPKRQQLVVTQQRQLTQYAARLKSQQRVADQRTAQLQQQRRMAQYRSQQDYLQRLREQQEQLQNARNYDYNADPYFYTASSYRYLRGGRYYQTNQYGADLLRQAINNGYQEGYRTGLADREDRWNYSYRSSYAYQDANYGYSGFYVDQSAYNYYFREGFQRGYDDSFYARNRYGSDTNGTLALLSGVLIGILDLQSLR